MTVFVAVLHLFLVAFFASQIYKKVSEGPFKRFFFPGLLAKLAAGLIYGFIYCYYYGYGDTLNYFSDALLLSDLAAASPQDYLGALLSDQFPDNIQTSLLFLYQPRALFLVKVTSVFALLSMGNYWICSLYFSFISFLGLFYLAKTCAETWPRRNWQVAIAFLFFPSVLFWSSGLSKESLVMGGIGFVAGVFLNLYFRKHTLNLPSLLAVLLSIYVIWVLKYYYAALLIPLLVTLLLVSYLRPYIKVARGSFAEAGFGLLLFFLLLWVPSQLHPILSLSRFMQHLVDQHNVIVSLSSPESLIHFKGLEPEFYSLATHIPLALFSGLFRPAVWDAATVFQWIVALENLLLLLFALAALWRIKDIVKAREKLLLLGVLVYILILAVVLTFAAPNFGTLVRYKIGFLPFFVFILIFDISWLHPLAVWLGLDKNRK